MPEFVVPSLSAPSAPSGTNVLSTLAELRTKVRQRLGETSADFWTDAEITDHLNEAQRQFAHEQRWQWLITSATGLSIDGGNPTLTLQQDVDLNRQFNILLTKNGEPGPYDPQPKRVSPANGFRLRSRMTYIEPGRPYYYYLSASTVDGTSKNVVYTVTFLPTPDDTYAIEYMFYREPLTMSGDTDTPLVPTAYEDALVAWATAQCWLKELNGSGKAQEQFNLYNATLAKAIADEKSGAMDDLLIIGGAEPQWMPINRDQWIRDRMPVHLG